MSTEEMAAKLEGFRQVKAELVREKAKIELEIGKLNASVAGHVANHIYKKGNR